jgi:hypothetical protein
MASKGGSRRGSRSEESTDNSPTLPATNIAQFTIDHAEISTITTITEDEADSSASIATASVFDHEVSATNGCNIPTAD